MRTRFISMGLTIVMSIGIFGMNVNAEEMTVLEQTPTDAYEEEFEDCEADVIVYDLNQMDTFKNRTLEQIADKYWEAQNAGSSYVSNESATYYKVKPSFEAPYEPGVLHEDTLAVMTGMTNFYRWLVGVKPVTSYNDAELQAGAFVRNFSPGHTVDNSQKPADMSDELWNMGADASHSILAYGTTPYGAIYAWMNEGYSLRKKEWDWGWNSIAHRTAIISERHSKIGFGYSDGVSIGCVLAAKNDNSYEGFAAYPCPGAMPNDLIRPSTAAWSFEYGSSNVSVSDESKVEIRITNLDTGKTWIRNKYTEPLDADNDMQFYSGYMCFVQPDDYNKENNRYESSYEVVISGMKDWTTGKEAQIKYRVDFMDVKVYGASEVTGMAMPYSSYIINDESALGQEHTLKKLQTTLPKEVVFEVENGCTYKVPVSGEWVLDEANQCWTNSVDESSLPNRITDPNGVLKKISFNYTFSIHPTWLGIADRNPYVGTSGTMTASLFRDANHSKIFQIKQNEYGQHNAIERCDSDTYADLKKETGYGGITHYYTFKSFEKSDTGEYVGVFYNDKVKNGAAYVPFGTINLNVTVEGASPNATGIYTAKSDYTGETLG
ncbi:MAG: CAP domain-containing protein, partial [Clostridium sp.]|nr:CAP domain-containing protein [Clostridium sp.]